MTATPSTCAPKPPTVAWPPAGGSSRKRKSSVIAGDLNAHLVAKAVRAQLRKTADPAAVSRKELREALEKQLGCDLAEWKGAIKDAAVAFIAA